MRKGDVIAIAGFILALNVLMMWCADVSVSGITDEVKKSVMDAYDILPK